MALRILRASLFLVTAVALAVFSFEAVRLMADPRPVDRIEGAVLDGAQRIADGTPLYDDSAEAVSPAPMPGYPLAVSYLMHTFGAQLWVPRFLALLATSLIALLVLTIVRMETDSWTLAVSGMGLVFMGHALLAEPIGIARPDSVMLLLSLLAFLELRVSTGVGGALAAGVLLAAALFVDQQAAWFIAAAGVALAIDDRKRLPGFVLLVGIAIAGGYVVLSNSLGPWFNFTVWDGPLASIRFSLKGLLHYVCDHLLGKLGISTLAAVLSFALPSRPWRGKSGLWMYFGIASLAAGMLASQSATFGPRDLIPGIVAIAMLGPISIQRVTGHLSTWPGSTRFAGRGVVLAAITLQVIVLLSCLPAVRWNGGASAVPASVSPRQTNRAPA